MGHDEFEDEREKHISVRSTAHVDNLTVVREMLGGITDCLADILKERDLIERRVVSLEEEKEVLKAHIVKAEKRLNKQSAVLSLVFGALVTVVLTLAYVIDKLNL